MNTNISVVVPAFNVERYIGECLDSLLAQNVADIEIICVNDGSTDTTPEILSDYAFKHDSISIVTQSNSGLSVARNTGLDRVTGSYVAFCDADDMFVKDAFSELVSRAEATSADIVYFDARSFFEDETVEQSHSSYKTYYHRNHTYNEPRPGKQLIADMSLNGEWRPSVPIQFYRTGFLNDIQLRFIPGITHEDNAFSYCAALHADSVTHIGKPLYLRRVHSHSIMTSGNSSRNVVGYFKCFLEMTSAAAAHDVKDALILAVPYDVLMLARNIYRTLTENEQQLCLEAFEGTERVLFWNAVVRDKEILDDADTARNELHAIRSSRRYAFAEKLAGAREKLPF